MPAERRQGVVPAEPVEARGIRPSTGSGRMLHPTLRGMSTLYLACRDCCEMGGVVPG
jgi:hypothetical protein